MPSLASLVADVSVRKSLISIDLSITGSGIFETDAAARVGAGAYLARVQSAALLPREPLWRFWNDPGGVGRRGVPVRLAVGPGADLGVWRGVKECLTGG